MTEALFLIPVEGDPKGLLASSHPDLGGDPPRVVRHVHKDGGWCWEPRCGRARRFGPVVAALPLVWKGKIVFDAWDRALRVLGISLPQSPDETDIDLLCAAAVGVATPVRLVR